MSAYVHQWYRFIRSSFIGLLKIPCPTSLNSSGCFFFTSPLHLWYYLYTWNTARVKRMVTYKCFSILFFHLDRWSVWHCFVTHYPPLAVLREHFPTYVGNFHMSFLLHDEEGKDPGVGGGGVALTQVCYPPTSKRDRKLCDAPLNILNIASLVVITPAKQPEVVYKLWCWVWHP